MTANTTLYVRGMDPQLVRSAKAEAARTGRTLSALISEALEQTLGRSPESSELDESISWFESNGPRLKKYRGEFVAILGKTLIDHDRDFDVLARRVFARVGHRAIFMPLVGESASTVAKIRSPRTARR
ncbi:MAG: hypothetical protein HY791_25560 [Deltaproteobacteria bacterium]|nr:hypothetical protein [Deltaproteobacteria bacterium]